MISIHNLSKSFGGKAILHGFSLDVQDGETVALLGLSGSGKTTILKCLCGLLMPDHGTITFDGVSLTAESRRQLRQRMGYVIQDGGLFPHLTLKQNLSIVGEETGLTAVEIETKTRELARLVKLPFEILARYPAQVSGGQRQRVGLMRALFLNPSYLLLDEPLGALDPITRRDLQDELKELIQRLGKTVILVTHDLLEARRLSTRIILLEHGAISQQGSMEDLIHHPANDFVRRFVQAQDHT